MSTPVGDVTGVEGGAATGGASPLALSTEIQGDVAVVTLDLPGEPVNKIGTKLKDEFTALFDRLERGLNKTLDWVRREG